VGGGWWGRFNAKKQFLRQLHARAGYPWPLTLESGFTFQMRQQGWHNVDQLEAVVEFYVNFPDPWAAGLAPLQPGDAGYTTVNLRPIKGADAHADGGGNWYKLDNTVDLSFVLANPLPAQNPMEAAFPADAATYPAPRRFLYSTIEFEADTSPRLSKRYRIAAVQTNQQRVQIDLDGAPAPIFKDNATSSKWTIHNPTTMVLIDPVGIRQYQGMPRLGGAQATVVQPLRATDPQILDLDHAPDLTRINPRFDTIYLRSDTNNTRKPFRAYRIVDPPAGVVLNANQVCIDGSPTLSGGSSAWHIPAGLSADEFPGPPFAYNLNPPAARRHLGFDHYDGLLFLVHDGKVIYQYRWSSYTSRQHGIWELNPPDKTAFGTVSGWDQAFSSIKGNRPYSYESFFSGGAFRNFCFAITDIVPGNTGLAHRADDRCLDAKYFFGTPLANGHLDSVVTQDLVAAGAFPGKTQIRIHRGNEGAPVASGCGSDGCVVSPNSALMRWDLTALYEDDYQAFHGPNSGDPQLLQICSNTACENGLAVGWPISAPIPNTDWNRKLSGVLWIIRPDEPI